MREALIDISKVWAANIAANFVAFVTLDRCQDIIALITGGLAALYTLARIHQSVTGKTILDSWKRRQKRIAK